MKLPKFIVNFVCGFVWSKGLRHAIRYHDVWGYLKCAHQIKTDRKKEKNRKFEYNLSVCAIVKNEAPYLSEWIEYHKMIGVEKFYIYDNESTDNILEVLASYIADGTVEYMKWPGQLQQMPVYNYCLNYVKYKTKWLAFIDIDEFLVSSMSLPLLLEKYVMYPSLSVCWVFYGDNGHRKKTSGLVIERFTKHAALAERTMVKVIVNPRRVYKMLVHHCIFVGNDCSVNEKYQKTPYADTNTSIDTIRLNHYYTKSYEEFLQKRGRGQSNFLETLSLDLYDSYNKDANEVVDCSMKKYVGPIKAMLKQRGLLEKNSRK